MKNNAQELEVKYYIRDLEALRRRLQELEAREVQPRTHEVNLRFDTPQRRLSAALQVLRLRKDRDVRLTYKGPTEDHQGVRQRQEIEFAVSDFESAKIFLEALGFEVAMLYEKYRAAYELDGVEVSLDEMPFGNFSELEGPDPGRIREVNRKLGLDWEARIPAGYIELFAQLCQKLELPFRDLSFENFAGRAVSPEDLGVVPAD